MKKIFCLSWLLLNLSLICSSRPTPAGSIDHGATTSLRAAVLSLLEANAVPGLALAVVSEKEILCLEVFGRKSHASPEPVTETTMFSIQSMSKNLTALAVLLAVQDGVLDLDAPICGYLPDFTINSRFEKNPEKMITLRLLLSHKAGLSHEAPIGNNYEINQHSFQDHIASISQTWLRFPVGRRYSYSNLGIDLAGYILQSVSGLEFHQYLENKLFKPLGLARSTFDPERITAETERAIGFNGSPFPPPAAVPMIPAGGMYTSVSDLACYVQFQLNEGQNNGRQLLKRETLADMSRIPGQRPRQSEGYGLGVYVKPTEHGPLLTHSGGGFGFLSNMTWYPEIKLGFVVLTNASHKNIVNQVLKLLQSEFLPAFEKTESPISENLPPTIEISEKEQKKHLGQYLYNSGGIMKLEWQDGRLGVNGGKNFNPFNFTAADEAYLVIEGIPYFYTFSRLSTGVPGILIREYDGEHLDLNEGPADLPGSFSPEWKQYLGKYQLRSYGFPLATLTVSEKNGYLYLDDFKLKEYKPGLFFSAHGETIDFRGTPPRARSIPLYRVD